MLSRLPSPPLAAMHLLAEVKMKPAELLHIVNVEILYMRVLMDIINPVLQQERNLKIILNKDLRLAECQNKMSKRCSVANASLNYFDACHFCQRS